MYGDIFPQENDVRSNSDIGLAGLLPCQFLNSGRILRLKREYSIIITLCRYIQMIKWGCEYEEEIACIDFISEHACSYD